MALGEGFTNPQRVINKSFDAFIRGGNDIVNKVATTQAEVTQNILKEKAYKEQQEMLENQQMQSMYSKVNEIGSTGNAALDENIMSFWNDKADEYFKIKNAMDKGVISKQEGNKALVRINGLVNQFKEEAKYLAEQTAMYKDDLQNNKVSSVGSIQNKNILNGIGTGGNVGIVERGGKLYYYQPEYTDENGNLIEASMVNGREMMASAATGDNLYKTIPDISKNLETAFNETYQPESLESKYVTTIDVKKGDPIPGTDGEVFTNIPEGEIYTYQIIDDEGKQKGQASMISSGILNPILNNDNIMQSYWQDSVPDEWLRENGYTDDIINSRWNDFPVDMSDEDKAEFARLQTEAATQYMAEKAYNDNADMDNKLKFMQKKSIPKPSSNKTSGKSRFSQANQLIYDTRRNDYIANVDRANAAYESGTPSPDEMVVLLKQANPGVEYFVNDSGLIQSKNTIIDIPVDAEGAAQLLNTNARIPREMQVVFSNEYKPSSTSTNEEPEEDASVDETVTIPKGAKVYSSYVEDGGYNDNDLSGILETEEERANFAEEYPDEEIKDPNSVHAIRYQQELKNAQSYLSGRKMKKEGSNFKEGLPLNDVTVIALALRRTKRKIAKADLENYGPDNFKN